MPKKKMPRADSGLPSVSPRELSSKEKAIYQKMRTQLVSAGYDSSAVLQSLIVAVRKVARMELLTGQVRKLKELTVEGSTGQLTLHPLVRELRSMEAAVESSLGKLLLTARSQSVSRLEKNPQQNSVEDDCVLRLLGG